MAAAGAAQSPILAGLNDAQIEAVTAKDGPHLILAGPGSGKTRVLTHRVAFLLRELRVPAYRVMAVTFTNKAAREMGHRIEALLSADGQNIPHSGLMLGTFHATCARFLRIEHAHTPYTQEYAIYDTRDQLDVVKRACDDLNVNSKRFKPRGLLSAISANKNELRIPAEVAERAETYFDEVAGRVYRRYQELLVENNALDFDDLLMQTVTLFREHPDVAEKYQGRFAFVLVDEFQDTNYAQYMLVKQLGDPQRNLFAVGDPDQSIYAFRGADYRNVLRFQEDYPEARTILLEQNYRSTQNILDAAMAVIDRNPQRTPKHLFTGRGAGEKLTLFEAYTDGEEAQHIVDAISTLDRDGHFTLNDCAVMYRTNAQSRALEDALNRAGIPYRLIGATRFYARREIKDLMAYLKAIHNPNDTFSLERIINTPTRGIGAKTVEALRMWADDLGVSMGVALLSLHTGADGPFNGRARTALTNFAELLAGWQAMAELDQPPLDILDAVIAETGYEAYLQDGTSEGQERWENVLELRDAASEKPDVSLSEYLAEVSLVSDVDTRDDDLEGPTLLTLHAAKGLEFPVVFIVGLSEGTLPHSRSVDADLNGDREAIPEERRLLYVGLTRAKDRLYLSYAVTNLRYGYDMSTPSRFLYDLPAHLLAGAPLPVSGGRGYTSYRRATSWESPGSAPERRGQPERRGPRYRAGMRVVHATFGEGIVLNATMYGSEEEVEVVFEESGVKRIDADYLAPLAG